MIDSEELITNNLPLARKYAWGWARRSQMAYEELEAIAFVGLVKGCRKYNPASGYRLSTIAVPFIIGEILHYFRDRGYAIKFPSRWREKMPRARRLLEAKMPPEAVCAEVGMPFWELNEMLHAMAGTTQLQDELVGICEEPEEIDVLAPVADLVARAWERLHEADQRALNKFWTAPGLRPVIPLQALGQFLTAARLALRGQRLPEIRRQLSLQLAVTITPAEKTSTPKSPAGRSRAQLEAQATQLGLWEGLSIQ